MCMYKLHSIKGNSLKLTNSLIIFLCFINVLKKVLLEKFASGGVDWPLLR